MEKLKAQLEGLIKRLENSRDFRASLENLQPVYPFNEYEYIISHLLASNKLTLDEYYELRNSYIRRNPYIPIFEHSPSKLENWACEQLQQLVPDLKTPNKKLDPKYSGEYDFLLDWNDSKGKPHSIRVEVKTSRAVDFERPDEPLYIKALASDSKRLFDMNFQQIKPKCADVFLWIAVWRDKIIYWVLSCSEVKNNKYFSKGQHRGNVGEGQLHLNRDNIAEFKKYEVISTQIKDAIIRAYKRETKLV